MIERTYKRPSRLKQFVLRQKRKTPGFLVDIFDVLQRLPKGYLPQAPFVAQNDSYAPFFIVGCGRSGNTLLRKLLMENARVVIPPEIPGLGAVIRRYSQVIAKPWPVTMSNTIDYFCQLANVNVQTTSIAGDSYCYNLKDELGIDFNKINLAMLDLSKSERSLARIINEIYQAYSYGVCGELLPWGDKTPWNVFHFDRLKKVFPNARYVHMLRDGRDCVVSYMDSLGDLMNLNYWEAAWRWRDSVRQAERIKRSVPALFLEVRYEDLTLHPEAIISTVVDFLGLERIELGGGL